MFGEPEVELETIKGYVEHVLFYNEENGYTVAKIVPDDQTEVSALDTWDHTITVVGVMPPLEYEAYMEFMGEWVTNPRYGKQFKAQVATPIQPTSLEGIARFISENVPSVGPKSAERIVEHFGTDTLDVLDNDPELIHEVPKLTQRMRENIIQYWKSDRADRKTMIYLLGYGISKSYAERIYQEYGLDTIGVVESNPYKLAEDVDGIGFKKADQIARNKGIEFDNPNRIRAGILYALSQLVNNGHTYAPQDVLMQTSSELLDVDNFDLIEQELAKNLLEGNLKQERLVDEDGNTIEGIYLPMYYHSERGAARLMKILINTPSKILNNSDEVDWEELLEELSQENSVELNDQQQSAVQAALISKVSILTGGPGTGKTTTLQMVIHALEELGYEYALASPTGRAAKRLQEATEREARTIHRLLGFTPQGGFQYDEDQPLDIDMLIVDEASMIDIVLFYNMLKAVKSTTHLMLVGDIDQLPSVGAGNVLNDVIDSGVAKVTRLTHIFRQHDKSYIVVNAHRVNEGEMPFTDNQSDDFYFFGATDPQQAADLVVDIVNNRIPKNFGYDPLYDVQVIAPMYRGQAGVNMLNTNLQQALNGGSHLAEKNFKGRIFRIKDKVMQTKNNYDKDVFNGDIGYIHSIDYDDKKLNVTIDGYYVEYDWADAEQLIHAYCISTHRSQGSEYPVVVMPVLTQHYMMLQRNLIYTAITRAKKMVVLVGDRRAIGMAVNNNQVAERYSALLYRLYQ